MNIIEMIKIVNYLSALTIYLLSRLYMSKLFVFTESQSHCSNDKENLTGNQTSVTRMQPVGQTYHPYNHQK